MKLSDMLKALGISKIRFFATAIFGGFADLAKLLADAITKLLKKANPDELRKCATLASNIAKFIRYGIELFVKKPKYKEAGIKTADAIDRLAQHIADGQYDEDEINEDFDNIKAAVDAWCNTKEAVLSLYESDRPRVRTSSSSHKKQSNIRSKKGKKK